MLPFPVEELRVTVVWETKVPPAGEKTGTASVLEMTSTLVSSATMTSTSAVSIDGMVPAALSAPPGASGVLMVAGEQATRREARTTNGDFIRRVYRT